MSDDVIWLRWTRGMLLLAFSVVNVHLISLLILAVLQMFSPEKRISRCFYRVPLDQNNNLLIFVIQFRDLASARLNSRQGAAKMASGPGAGTATYGIPTLLFSHAPRLKRTAPCSALWRILLLHLHRHDKTRTC